MRRSKTKFLSIFICCIMMVSLIPTVAFAAGTEGIPIDEAHFPDSNFRDHLTRLNDKNVNGVMEPEEIAATIDLTFTGEGVKDLTGLDYFSNLKHFAYYSGGLTSIDVSKLQNLEDLWVSGNELTNLDVSKNTKLKSLSCEANNLAQLDISNNPELVELHCSNNPLTYLDLSNNSKLERIVSYFNQLTSLDTSNTQCRDKQLCLTNSREIQLNGDIFDLSTLKGFDVNKASNWDGGSVKGTILTVDSEASQVTYRYDCGNGNYAIFTLTFKKPEHVHAGVLQPAKKATFTADGSKNTGNAAAASYLQMKNAEKNWKCQM